MNASGDIHRRRTLAALNHDQADRIPLTMGGPSCALHREAHANLLRYLGMTQEQDAPVFDRILQIVQPDPQILRRFDIDLLWLVPREGDAVWSEDRQSCVDDFGRTFIAGGGFLNQTGHPLVEGGLDELRAYRFPDLAPDRVAGLRSTGRASLRAGLRAGRRRPVGHLRDREQPAWHRELPDGPCP